MNPSTRTIEWLGWGGIVLVIATLLLAFIFRQLNLRTTQPRPLLDYGQIGDFSLTNQDGQTVSLSNLLGHVWVADIIFTRCQGPCLKMTRQMKELQQALGPNSRARLVSLTTDADFDTPAVLKIYSARFGADPNRWLFLTGRKEQIASLAVESLKLIAEEKKPEERETPHDLFMHSTLFVIVDKKGNSRGVFETIGPNIEPSRVQTKILQAIRELDREK